MTPPGLLFAAAALVPAMTGVPGGTGVAQVRTLALALCGGGSTILLLGGTDRPASGTTPCCAKGCRAGARKRRGGRAR